MASTVSILIAARSSAAAALAAARAQVAALARAAAAANRTWLAHTRTVNQVSGAYRDANGRWRDAHGRFISMTGAVRTSTTVLGRLVDVMENWTTSIMRNLPAMGLMIGKFAGIVAVALPLIGALSNLIPLVMLAAPAAASAGLAMLTFKLALNGVSDALSAGLSGDTEAFEKALKKLEPAAAYAVRTLVKLRDAWKPLQQRVQGEIFAGVAQELMGLDKFIRPVAERQLPKLAISIAAIRNQLANGLANYAADGRLEKVWDNLNVAVSKLLVAAVPLARAFGDILEVASPRFAKIAGYVQKAAEAFGDWIRQAKESGKLGEWLDKAMETFGKLKDIATNVGRIIGAIFQASGDEGDSMLDQIAAVTEKIADWANGGDGQKVISIASSIIEILGQLAPLFELWAGWLSGMTVLWGEAWNGIKAIFAGVIGWILGGYDLLLQGAAKAFGWVPGLGDKLRSAQKAFEEFKNNVNRSLDGIEDEVVNITYHSRVIGDRMVSGAQLSGTYSSGIGGRAAGGPGGAVKQINERGAEFVDFTRGMVYNSNQTKRMQAAMAGGGGGASVTVEFGRPAPGAHLANATLDEIRGGRLPLFVTVGGQRHQVKPA